ncbi:NAD-dependent epimerase/dehydratase family protein [Shimia biformata]|uniref:NAD-dependent epimerase/dehydratase family protein n=1 Tax=Shimia biformata TaxID=1294299 RepID=UPI00194E993D|nr:NAD-dependent epimerase/dehydratase family protein [Shimia biformata]
MATDTHIRTGLIGAGYIADWHADAIAATPGARLVAVCDASVSAARGFAESRGIMAFTSVDDMIASGTVDAVHVLTPPNTHAAIARSCLEAGLHVLVEKPAALNGAEIDELDALAGANGLALAVGHNFLGIPGYARLKEKTRSGALGRITSVDINWHFPLAPLRSGPFGLWLLRAPENLLLELGPHLFAFAVDLIGPIEVVSLHLGKPIALPGDTSRAQSWRIAARAGDVDVSLSLSLVETVDDRTVTVRGSSGLARLDYANDVLTTRSENAADIVLNPFLREMSAAAQHLREGAVNGARQLLSLNRKSPYALGFRGLSGAFYGAIGSNSAIDDRFSGASATAVMVAIDQVLAMMPKPEKPPRPKSRKKPKPEVLIVGGTGFIGRALTRALVASGRDVCVLSRGAHGPFSDIADHVQMTSASLTDRAALEQAMEGIDTVFHLGKSKDSTWDSALRNDVGPTVALAEAAMTAGVRRFVYTGTIASYDMSDPDVRITEDTGFAEDMSDRNIYARSKAECEKQLLQLHRDKRLPLVIARPGIVVGKGGPLQHWGIGRWHGAGAVRIWGRGQNTLPFVLNSDIAAGLIRMIEADGIEGESFNLVGDNLFTARDYFDAIHARLGARITVRTGNLHMFWLMDGVKYALKRHALGRRGAVRASIKDWKSRAHFSAFDNNKPKRMLGWTPVNDREAFLKAAIDDADLFGF